MGKLLVRFWEGQESNWGMEKILWHRRESRRQTEKTNIFLQPREAPAYSNFKSGGIFPNQNLGCLPENQISAGRRFIENIKEKRKLAVSHEYLKYF